jgi:hypothetical protein
MWEKLGRMEEFAVVTPYLTPETLRGAFAFGKGWLSGSDAIKPNTKLQPVLMDYYQRDWR